MGGFYCCAKVFSCWGVTSAVLGFPILTGVFFFLLFFVCFRASCYLCASSLSNFVKTRSPSIADLPPSCTNLPTMDFAVTLRPPPLLVQPAFLTPTHPHSYPYSNLLAHAAVLRPCRSLAKRNETKRKGGKASRSLPSVRGATRLALPRVALVLGPCRNGRAPPAVHGNSRTRKPRGWPDHRQESGGKR